VRRVRGGQRSQHRSKQQEIARYLIQIKTGVVWSHTSVLRPCSTT